MTNEERDIISRFVARVGGSPEQGFGAPPAGSQVPALPAVDPDADRFISDQFSQHPEARYRITQMAFVQEAALAEAQNRIRRLEWELQQARSQQQGQGQPQGGAPSRGFFGSLFGGGQQQAGQAPGGFQGQPQGYGRPPGYGQQQYQSPPQPQYPPGYQPGMLQQRSGGGSGFLGSALTTAAGVAGGMVAGNALMGLFSGHEGGGFGGGGGHETVNETINNYGTDPSAAGGADPWAGAGTTDTTGGFPQDQGALDQGSGFDQGGVDSGGFDQGSSDQGGWGDSGGGGDDPFS